MQAIDMYITKSEYCVCVCVCVHKQQVSQRSHYWVIIMSQGETILFMDQCSGDMKYALKMVEKNLNNLRRFCHFPIVTVCKYSCVSLKCEYKYN